MNVDVIVGLKNLRRKAKAIICDPPYNIGKDYHTSKTNLGKGDYLEWCLTWIGLCSELLEDDGTMFIYGFPEKLAPISASIELEHRWLAWHYTNKTVPGLNFWQRSFESILVCWKNKPVFYRDEVREPYTEAFKKTNGKVRKATQGRFGKTETTYKVNDKGALPRDVIKVPALAGGAGSREVIGWCNTCGTAFQGRKEHKTHDHWVHPTQKPMELTRRLLKSCTKPGEHIIVPFAGSCSELLVAQELKLTYDAFDLNPDYVRLGNNLLKKG